MGSLEIKTTILAMLETCIPIFVVETKKLQFPRYCKDLDYDE